MRIARFIFVCFLSSLAFTVSHASAADCYATKDAMAYVRAHDIHFTLLSGERAQQFVPVNAGIETVSFAAFVARADGAGAMFFGNFAKICGPYLVNKKQVAKFLRPA